MDWFLVVLVSISLNGEITHTMFEDKMSDKETCEESAWVVDKSLLDRVKKGENIVAYTIACEQRPREKEEAWTQ